MEKGGRLDIQATLNDGLIINIEMQVNNEHNIEKRSEIYASKTISRHFEKGGSYINCPQVIMVNILDFNLFGFEEYVSTAISVLDKHRDYKIDSIAETYYIELPKFRKSKPDMSDKLNQWLSFLDDENKEEIEMAKKENKIIEEAKIELDYLTGDEEVRRLAELQDKWKSDWNSYMDWTRTDAKLEIAKKMLDKKMPLELISEITGLTIEKIEKL